MEAGTLAEIEQAAHELRELWEKNGFVPDHEKSQEMGIQILTEVSTIMMVDCEDKEFDPHGDYAMFLKSLYRGLLIMGAALGGDVSVLDDYPE